MKNENGITLVTLVVTIVVMIILSTVVIQTTVGDNGLIKKVKKEKQNVESEIMKVEEEKNKLILEMQQDKATTYIVDRTILNDNITQGELILSKIHLYESGVSIDEFNQALRNAKEVANDANADQLKVDQASKNLSISMKNLVKIDLSKLDFTILDAKLEEIEINLRNPVNISNPVIYYEKLHSIVSRKGNCVTQEQIDALYAETIELENAIKAEQNAKKI